MSSIIDIFDKYNSGFSDLPILIETNNNYKNHYINLIVAYDKYEVSLLSGDFETISVNGKICTKIVTTSAHNFEKGDYIYIIDENDIYFGIYNIVEVFDDNTLAIDMIITEIPYGDDFYISRFRSYEAPFSNKQTYFELQEDLSTMIKSDYDIYNSDLHNAKHTRLNFDILVNEYYNYKVRFEDNAFLTGNFVGFFNTNITSMDDIPFRQGDVIIIEQDLTEWGTTGYRENDGNLEFFSNNENYFLIGQTITMTEHPNPLFNRDFTIIDVSDNGSIYNVVVNYNYSGSQVNDGGRAWGNPRQMYDGIATITDIEIHPSLGLLIKTDKIGAGSTSAIGGYISFANGRLIKNYNTDFEEDLNIYNSNILNFDWNKNNMDKYVIQDRSSNLNNFSTIIKNDIYHINRNSKNTILVHTDGILSSGVGYIFYDKNNVELGSVLVENNNNYSDFYINVSYLDILEMTKVNITNIFNNYKNDISYVEIVVLDAMLSECSNKLKFKYIDCVQVEEISLSFRDSLGSLISKDFNLLNREFIETDKKQFYSKTSKYKNNEWTTKNRGLTNYSNRQRTKLLLNTDFIKEEDIYILEDLFRSSEVFINYNNDIISVNIVNDTIEKKKKMVDGIFSYTFEVEYTHDEKTK